MALTRSFLTSYFIVDDRNDSFYEIYSSAIKRITEEGKMELQEPTSEERQEMATKIQITLSAERKTFAQIMDDFFNAEYPQLSRNARKFVEDTINQIASKLPEEQIKQRTRSFIEEVMGAALS
jgi:hypothetical protein